MNIFYDTSFLDKGGVPLEHRNLFRNSKLYSDNFFIIANKEKSVIIENDYGNLFY